MAGSCSLPDRGAQLDPCRDAFAGSSLPQVWTSLARATAHPVTQGRRSRLTEQPRSRPLAVMLALRYIIPAPAPGPTSHKLSALPG